MKKSELPKLSLSKRTIANLNNMEMRYVLGGDGDDASAKICDQEDVEESTSVNDEMVEKIKKLIITLPTLFNCK